MGSDPNSGKHSFRREFKQVRNWALTPLFSVRAKPLGSRRLLERIRSTPPARLRRTIGESPKQLYRFRCIHCQPAEIMPYVCMERYMAAC